MSSSNSGNYGMPYFLADQTGLITETSFSDIYQRMSFSLRCTVNNPTRAAYVIYDTGSRAGRGGLMVPIATLDFGGPGGVHALGGIKIKDSAYCSMDQWLSKVRNHSSARVFTATDNQQYTWKYSGGTDAQWVCSNSRNYQVASYSIQSPGEVQHDNSGNYFWVEESFAGIAGELLAALIIMRHIKEHNL